MSTSVEDVEVNTTMFRVKVFRNGTLDTIEFNKLSNNETIGDLPKYLKMFFPKLDKYLYESESRLLQSA